MARKQTSKKRNKRKIFVRIGMLLGMAALLSACVGLIIDARWHQRDVQAAKQSENVLPILKERSAVGTDILFLTTDGEEERQQEGAVSEEAAEQDTASNQDMEQVKHPDNQEKLYDQIPEKQSYTVIGDVRYMGILSIPALGLELPIILSKEWEPELMDIAPCTYSGSIKTHDLVIMAHNYQAHFLGILSMQAGQEVMIKTVDGMCYVYTVTAVDVMHRSEKEKLYMGEWDLTLFTCVPQTYNRCAVRCKLVAVENGSKGKEEEVY